VSDFLFLKSLSYCCFNLDLFFMYFNPFLYYKLVEGGGIYFFLDTKCSIGPSESGKGSITTYGIEPKLGDVSM
jgi:hypothetical protein